MGHEKRRLYFFLSRRLWKDLCIQNLLSCRLLMTTTKAKNARRLKKREKIGNGSSLVSFQNMLKENKNLTPEFQPGLTVLTRDEVAKHNTPSDCWTIYKGHVYNISPFLEYHPGGEDELMKGAGTDCTLLYDKVHPWVNADAVLGPLRLGVLQKEASAVQSPKFGSPPRPSLIPPSPSKSNRGSPVKPQSPIPVLRIPIFTPKLTIVTSAPVSPKAMQVRAHHLLNGPIGIFKLYSSIRSKYIA